MKALSPKRAKPPRLTKQDQVAELKAEAQHVRVAWELGRLRRRLELDLRTLLLNTEHWRVVPIRAGDPRVAAATRDKQLQKRLRDTGMFDEQELIYGGESQVAHRPFRTETLTTLRSAQRALADAFVQARFSSPLEWVAFTLTPKDPDEDLGRPTEHQWHDAWLAITRGRYAKTVACEAIGLDDHAYDERRRRPRARTGGISAKVEELLTWLREETERERKSIKNHREYIDYVSQLAQQRGIVIPKALRRPTYSKRTRDKLPPDCRFLDDDRARWSTNLSAQPSASRAAWKQLIALREERLA